MEIKTKFKKGDEVCFFRMVGFSEKTVCKFKIEGLRITYKDTDRGEKIDIQYYGQGIDHEEQNLFHYNEIENCINEYCDNEILEINKLREKLMEDSKKDFKIPVWEKNK